MPDREREKRRAAEAAVAQVVDGTVIGLGSGSSVAHAVAVLAERVRAGLRVEVVAASHATEALVRGAHIPLVDFSRVTELALSIDGADEVDPALRMIKGGGGALLREKVVAHAARRALFIVDASKQVGTLGSFPLPLEVLPFALPVVERTLVALGARPARRTRADGSPYLTDNANMILDCAFGSIAAPEELARALSEVPGVLAHGLFLHEASSLFVAQADRVREVTRPSA